MDQGREIDKESANPVAADQLPENRHRQMSLANPWGTDEDQTGLGEGTGIADKAVDIPLAECLGLQQLILGCSRRSIDVEAS